MNRLRKIWKPVPMSGDMTVTRSRTWHFSHTLYTSLKPEAVRGLRTCSIDPWDFIKHMFIDLFKQGSAGGPVGNQFPILVISYLNPGKVVR